MWGGGERTTLFVDAGCNVTAVDIFDNRKPELVINGYDFVIADGRILPFGNNIFDAVVSFDVIEHVDEDLLFLREAYRVTRNSGIFILGTPNRNRLSHKLRQLIGKKVIYPLKLGEGCVHLREYTMDGLSGLVKKVGFRVTKEKYIWFGLPGVGGLKRFPVFLDKWVQYILVFAIKP